MFQTTNQTHVMLNRPNGVFVFFSEVPNFHGLNPQITTKNQMARHGLDLGFSCDWIPSP